ncbi:hypothetical protein CGMCC3_g8635 [Colletotrichum fructicola]|nr:uncharacterized protein CGMCC3_g8635 [Colletotrichum fructicola]KAE9575254.1 hypothetical protein CGMCC3_g8635 [Colletotrichum fructicola]
MYYALRKPMQRNRLDGSIDLHPGRGVDPGDHPETPSESSA